MTPLEFLASGARLQSGAFGGLVVADQAVRKGGMIQITVFTAADTTGSRSARSATETLTSERDRLRLYLVFGKKLV